MCGENFSSPHGRHHPYKTDKVYVLGHHLEEVELKRKRRTPIFTRNKFSENVIWNFQLRYKTVTECSIKKRWFVEWFEILVIPSSWSSSEIFLYILGKNLNICICIKKKINCLTLLVNQEMAKSNEWLW